MALTKALEQKLKNIYPEGRGLDMDRRYRAKDTLDPRNPKDVKAWAKDFKNKDLKGFDTPDAKEKSASSVLKAINKQSGLGYIESETEAGAGFRFVDPRQQMGKLIQRNKDKIFDYNSLKEVVKKAWGEDLNLTDLVKTLKDGDMNVLFKQPLIQKYINENTSPFMVKYIIKKYKVEPVRASKIVNKLSPQVRSKLFIKARTTTLPKLSIPKRQKRISKWSVEQSNFIRVNKGLSSKKLSNLYNQIFIEKRSENSIKDKLNLLKS